jgi:hypothetical protein
VARALMRWRKFNAAKIMSTANRPDRNDEYLFLRRSSGRSLPSRQLRRFIDF